MNSTGRTIPGVLTTPPINEDSLEELLSRPTPGVLNTLNRLQGDIVLLGVGGKMGPTLARMIRRAWETLGKKNRRVFGAARFTNTDLEQKLQAWGVETVRCDLLDRSAVQNLPEAPNVIYMAGQKFGTTGDPAFTWAMNALAPSYAAEKYAGSRTVVFSTGCVYPNTPVFRGGSLETDALEPLGEYANSCVARERIYAYHADLNSTPVLFFRLNYAIELRYGVLLDVALKVANGKPIDLRMGHVNVIWQGDANAWAIQSLEQAALPSLALNITGPETISIRTLAERFGMLLGCEPCFQGEEAETALLSNARQAFGLFGYPTITLAEMVRWVAGWVAIEGPTFNKPTHFEARDGRF
jgi:hypothetical protein